MCRRNEASRWLIKRFVARAVRNRWEVAPHVWHSFQCQRWMERQRWTCVKWGAFYSFFLNVRHLYTPVWHAKWVRFDCCNLCIFSEYNCTCTYMCVQSQIFIDIFGECDHVLLIACQNHMGDVIDDAFYLIVDSTIETHLELDQCTTCRSVAFVCHCGWCDRVIDRSSRRLINLKLWTTNNKFIKCFLEYWLLKNVYTRCDNLYKNSGTTCKSFQKKSNQWQEIVRI